jgi:hypothetical protein
MSFRIARHTIKQNLCFPKNTLRGDIYLHNVSRGGQVVHEWYTRTHGWYTRTHGERWQQQTSYFRTGRDMSVQTDRQLCYSRAGPMLRPPSCD